MRVNLHGPFRVFDDLDRDITPKGMKERGLFALLLFSAGQRCTRTWMQDKLWSDRSPEQASTSFRQALSKLRKALGPLGDRLHSNRSALWIDPPLPLGEMLNPALGELLQDIDIADPEFADWLRLHRSQASPGSELQFRPQRPFARICRINRSVTERSIFGLRALSQRIANRLGTMIDLDVIDADADDTVLSAPRDAAQPLVQIELECLDESEMAFYLLRVIGFPNRRIIWSGRLSVVVKISELWVSADVTRAVNQVAQAACDALTATIGLTPMAAIQRAIRRQYEFDRAGLTKADELLHSAMDSDLRGLALAWRGMVRLNEVMEFGEIDPDRQTEALDFVQQAARLAPDVPVILSMASEVTLLLSGDVDMAGYFANRAMAVDDQDPETLAAYGRTLSFEGKNAESHRVALAARHNAQGSPYSYDWDLMAGVAKIRMGDLAGAFDMMLSCHRKMPFGRQALRYLTVLSLLADRDDDALRFAGRLRRLEPDFKLDLLRGNYAPLAFKRDVDLMDMVRHKLTS